MPNNARCLEPTLQFAVIMEYLSLQGLAASDLPQPLLPHSPTRSPNLSVGVLEEDHRGISGLSRLVRGCLDGKLPEPRSKAFLAVQEALAKASVETTPKDRRAPVRAFLPTFRKLCSSSFCIG